MKKIEISCSRCGAPTLWQDNPSRPFCSEKCRLIDLGRWSSEEYAIGGEKVPQHDRDDDLF